MNKMTTQHHITTTDIPGVLKITRQTFPDARGFFREVLHFNELNEKLSFPFVPVQVNHSLSLPGVIRAIHAEHWNKLVYPVTGSMFAALVDIRPASPNFGCVQTFIFNEDSRFGLFIPEGVANSICVIGTEPVNYVYLVDKYYDGRDTTAVAWDDPDLHIKWPVKNPLLSERDHKNPCLRDLFPDKFK